MQLPSSPNPQEMPYFEAALQPERLNRYMAAAEDDKDQAVRLYLWNCTLCEAFLIPLHFSEIVCRNALQRSLKAKLGNNWYENETFLKILDERYRCELAEAIKQERKQQGGAMTAHHVVSALSFGFWQHLVTKRFDRLLWSAGIKTHFPNAPAHKSREDLSELIEKIRRWRNRIAHHRAIFDKGPMFKYQAAIELIKWVCPTTAAYVASISKVPAVIELRPKQRDLFSEDI
ncbi:MAG: Abi family protein [Alphaproteobacteria bacterium]|nr:Abi family protein [Alphaproteobacteria bacterium]